MPLINWHFDNHFAVLPGKGMCKLSTALNRTRINFRIIFPLVMSKMNAEDFYFQSYELLSSWKDAPDVKHKHLLLSDFIKNSEDRITLTVHEFSTGE